MALEEKLTPYQMIARRRELIDEFYSENRELYNQDIRSYWVECMKYVSHRTRGLRYKKSNKGRRKT